MVVKLEPYWADPALVTRVYPVQPYHEIIAARANLARAYATTGPNTPSCDKVPNCSCCKKSGSIYYTWKGPQGTTNGKNCDDAEKNYEKAHGDCKATTVNLDMGTGYTDTNPKVYSPGGHYPAITPAPGPGIGPHDASGPDVPDEPVKKSTKKSDSGKTGEELLGDLESSLQKESGGQFQPVTDTPTTGGVPQDLFAKIPAVSKFFNSIYTKVCTANMKIPFVCQSLAYFEITIIAVVVLVLVLLFGRKRRR